ncbi:ECF transporter S component [Pseudoclostridium thermosuccinogenes]|uniref:ECF transporter S component n=1 Tax=Clostridium thermosuccinogenes TaxID=84032 RepID=UPI002FDA6390
MELLNKLSTKRLVLSGLFLALGLLIPFLTAQIPNLGSRLLPMHIPILLCGFICGWPYGLIIGLVLPVFRSMMFGMPPMFPTAVAMAFELAAYGLMTGLLHKLLPKNNVSIYASLILSMVCGRIVWGIVSFFLYRLNETAFTWEIFMAGAFLNAIPGIVIQIIIIPVAVIALSKAKLIESVS